MTCASCGAELRGASVDARGRSYCSSECAHQGRSVSRAEWIALGAPGYQAGPDEARRIWEKHGLNCDQPGQQTMATDA